MNFARQVQRASQRQELDLVRHTVQALSAENTQLQMENKTLFRAMGAMVIKAGGEVRLPKDLSELLKGKRLVSDVEGEEIVFRIVDEAAPTGETTATTY